MQKNKADQNVAYNEERQLAQRVIVELYVCGVHTRQRRAYNPSSGFIALQLLGVIL